MPPTTTALAAAAFVEKWDRVTLNERSIAQTHFNELCRLLGQKGPIETDPDGTFYRFEKPLTKVGGRAGFADVWRKDHFAWEYKTKGKYPDLRAAYQQLLLYKEDLDNPPILAACDVARYEVHIAFTGHKTRIETFTNADLRTLSTRELLHLTLTDPEQLRPTERIETVTEQAAARLATIAQLLERRGVPADHVAAFFTKLIFAFFAEDIGLLPNHLMSASLKQTIARPEEFPGVMRTLFQTMQGGGYFGPLSRVPRFNGGLFEDDAVVPLTVDEIHLLYEAAKLDWKDVEPSIFGTLFERSLDPSQRSQLGKHYTSQSDILLIVEPVLMDPLRCEWAEVHAQVERLRPQWEHSSGFTRQRLQHQMEGRLFDFIARLSQVRVLDPACGSGNFLYVALQQLKALEKEVWAYAGGLGLTQPELGVAPAQFYGIEKNPYAAALAQVVVWIGYWQWKRANGFLEIQEPIIERLDTIQCRDAILEIDEQGRPAEPKWPEADVIIGNPPFLGGSKLRRELGDAYSETLWQLYGDRIPNGADLVTYWFERSRAAVVAGHTQRAGLLATNSIRGGANRRVLERIKETGDIFMAWGDRPWVLDGAAVRVSMVGFGQHTSALPILDGQSVSAINADLTAMADVTHARPLAENQGIGFRGNQKGGPFDIPGDLARSMLTTSNCSEVCNCQVVRPWFNGLDITRRPRDMWIIDFGVDTPIHEAASYELPFAYVERHVYPVRKGNNRKAYAERWWIHNEARPSMRSAIASLKRYIVTPHVSKHRLFVWLEGQIVPDHQLIVIARDDDYFFGVLHSQLHELWSLRMGTSLEDRPRYTPTTTFETFPFPWPPGHEPHGDPRIEVIAAAARDLVEERDAWLNPAGAGEAELKQRTLTNLYNVRPDWLDEAHRALDAAVLDAYGWPHDLCDEEILARLLALNLERAAGQGGAVAVGVGAENLAD